MSTHPLGYQIQQEQVSVFSTNNIVVEADNNFYSGSLPSDTTSYLGTQNKNYKADSSKTISNSATFNNLTIFNPPLELPSIDKDNYTFFINGMKICNEDVVSFIQSFTDCVVVFNIINLGYGLDNDDIIEVNGKFE